MTSAAWRLTSSPQVQGCASVCPSGSELFTLPTVLEFNDVLENQAEQRVLGDLVRRFEYRPVRRQIEMTSRFHAGRALRDGRFPAFEH